MISHRHKCIFIHIPRTGGSSIELAIKGREWWVDNLEEKHTSAREARRLYGDKIWNEYYKFSFVRNPWDRIISLWKSNLYTDECTLYDFLIAYKPARHEFISPYYNDILNEKINFIGRFENLQNDFDSICEKIGLKEQVLPHFNKVDRGPYEKYFTKETWSIVSELYKRDIKHFGYFNNSPKYHVASKVQQKYIRKYKWKKNKYRLKHFCRRIFITAKDISKRYIHDKKRK